VLEVTGKGRNSASVSILYFGLLLCLGAGSKAQTPNRNEKPDPAPLVVELTAMVAQHGWVANLGRVWLSCAHRSEVSTFSDKSPILFPCRAIHAFKKHKQRSWMR
jgi:hypothetical protein